MEEFPLLGDEEGEGFEEADDLLLDMEPVCRRDVVGVRGERVEEIVEVCLEVWV